MTQQLSPFVGAIAQSSSVLVVICSWLPVQSICRLARTHSSFRRIISSAQSPLLYSSQEGHWSCSDVIWKGLALRKWPELNDAVKSIESDPAPCWYSLFVRKAKTEGEFTLADLSNDKEFRGCDWYSCPNGHFYLIGECRLPMVMAKCPTCGERIGGAAHARLANNKRVGRVFDRALMETGKANKIKFEEIEQELQKRYAENKSVAKPAKRNNRDLVFDYNDSVSEQANADSAVRNSRAQILMDRLDRQQQEKEEEKESSAQNSTVTTPPPSLPSPPTPSTEPQPTNNNSITQPASPSSSSSSSSSEPQDYAFWDRKSYAELKRECDRRGIKVLGGKEQLIKLLLK